MSSPPPPVPKRPSLKILKKLKTVIKNESKKNTATNINIETATGETSILPKKNAIETTEKKRNDNDVIRASKREI